MKDRSIRVKACAGQQQLTIGLHQYLANCTINTLTQCDHIWDSGKSSGRSGVIFSHSFQIGEPWKLRALKE